MNSCIDLLAKLRYVDDFGKGNKNEGESRKLITDTENVLGNVGMNVKGWAQSGKDPPSEISDDGISIMFAGLKWTPSIDVYSLNIDALHFGKKKRGRYNPELIKLDGSFGMSVEDFVPLELTRRMCTSVAARIYDPPQKLAPLHLRLKYDLRQIIKFDSSWDKPIPSTLRSRWIEIFKMIEDLRDVVHVRCPIPVDALRPTVRLWLKADGANGGIIVSVYSGNERPNNM